MRHHKCLVLVVDEDPDILESLLQVLQEQGFETVGAANGAEAVALAQRERPNVLLIDPHLPDVHGAELVELLRRAGLAPQVVLTSTHANVATLAQNLQVRSALAKPFDLDDCVEAVTAACEDAS